MITAILFAIINGLIWGLAVALVAIGLVLTFGFLRLLNLAHGAFYALGAVLGFYVVSSLHSFSLAVILALLVVGGLGILVERALLRPVREIPNGEVLITFGVAMIVEYAILLIFGGAPRRIPYPFHGVVTLLGSSYPIYRLVIGGVSLAVLTGWMFILERTRFGLQVRAANQDAGLARSLGIPVGSLNLATFGAGAACAALAGLILAPLVAVEFRMGGDIMAISFLVTILGGLTHVWRIAGVALATAVAENLGALWLDPRLTRGLVLLLLFVILLGMYARRDTRRSI